MNVWLGAGKTMTKTTALHDWFLVAVLRCAIVIAAAIANPPALAAGCSFELQGEGRVVAIIDARSFRMEDGREVRLAGIETSAAHASALSALVAGRNVTLRGQTDAPDRYGRQPAFVFVQQAATPVQNQLLAQGDALASGTVADKACAAELLAAEAAARQARRGIWTDRAAIKNAESRGDILARIGQFTVVEGKVLSVRQAGATSYINFGRRWTRDFAVTISRRAMPAFEAAGISLKSLENKRIRVRGWVEARGGPRIEAAQAGQIEMAGEN
ncbi:thermonuclease family protein [Bradyrhizobium sp.]|jgi:endonuclease YncB( thermonuclease family)|uniref:thermonuclease family protein n=1 Tax=Bradyrhizobium sp. TaxID=376 RepID=UPI002E083659|nr:thermonuclease family protein [Bradyrhizobium sp.]